MRELLLNALYGPGSYFQSNHMVVLALGVLLFIFGAEKKITVREKRLLGLTVMCLVLVLFPVSAAALMLYQTRFYGYHWIWCLVPLTPCIAWGGVRILWELTGQQRRDGREAWRLAGGMAALLALLLLTGNLGNVRSVSAEEKTRLSQARQAAACLEELPEAEEELLWAPRPVLEAVRQQTGEIRLLYGRNMWEPAAAAYAYDSYPTEQQHLFDWMEVVDKGEAYEMPLGLKVYLEDVAAVRDPDRPLETQVQADAHILWLAAEQGARLWVFPARATERVTLACGKLQETYGLQPRLLEETDGYTVWSCGRRGEDYGK